MPPAGAAAPGSGPTAAEGRPSDRPSAPADAAFENVRRSIPGCLVGATDSYSNSAPRRGRRRDRHARRVRRARAPRALVVTTRFTPASAATNGGRTVDVRLLVQPEHRDLVAAVHGRGVGVAHVAPTGSARSRGRRSRLPIRARAAPRYRVRGPAPTSCLTPRRGRTCRPRCSSNWTSRGASPAGPGATWRVRRPAVLVRRAVSPSLRRAASQYRCSRRARSGRIRRLRTALVRRVHPAAHQHPPVPRIRRRSAAGVSASAARQSGGAAAHAGGRGRALRPRPCLTLNTLERWIGRPTFDAAVARFVAEYGGRPARIADFTRDHLGRQRAGSLVAGSTRRSGRRDHRLRGRAADERTRTPEGAYRTEVVVRRIGDAAFTGTSEAAAGPFENGRGVTLQVAFADGVDARRRLGRARAFENLRVPERGRARSPPRSIRITSSCWT